MNTIREPKFCSLRFLALTAAAAVASARANTSCALNNACPDQFDPPGYGITPMMVCNPDPGSGAGPALDPVLNPAARCGSCSGSDTPTSSSAATYWVSEPFSNLRIEVSPLGYRVSHGFPLEFRLSYRQRGAVREDSTVFGFGTGWSSSLRAYLVDLTGTVGVYRVHRGGAGYIDYVPGAAQYHDGSIATSITGGFQIEYRDGSKEVFTNSFVNAGGYTLYFLSTRADPAGTAFVFNYSTVGSVFELTSVTDADGHSTQMYYENSSFPNQVTKVVDPFSRTNLLTYNGSGYLTNLVDVAGLTSAFQYDLSLWQSYGPSLTNMVTAYGATGFTFGGVDSGSLYINSGTNSVNRFVQTALPNGGTDLYEYRLDCSGFMGATNSLVPSTSPLGNTLDNVDQQNRNSFHWSPLQAQALSTNNPLYLSSTDYGLGRLRHFLIDPNSTDASYTFSLERAPSPDKTTQGQFIWYDHSGKTNGNNYIGTNNMSSFVALLLPDGTSRYTHYGRNPHGNVTQDISTYTKTDGSVGLRTNNYYFAGNNIDIVQQVGPNGEQVVSNYFSTGNIYHQPDATYDALNQQTAYLYNANRQVTQITRPSGLTTTNGYFSSGTCVNWLNTTIDLEISRTNSFTYSSGLVYSHTDERGLTTTNFWDNLQRLTGVLHPDGTTTSNRYTALDVTSSKDRDGNWSSFLYNSVRQKIAETNANGAVTRYGYCSCGMLEEITNALNQITSFNYDYQGNRTYTFFPDATQTNWFNSLGQLTVTSIGWGYQTNAYNNQGLATNISNAYGVKRAVIFDNENRPFYVTDDNGVTLTNTYDLLGRVTSRGYPDGGVENFAYSARGMTAYTNQIGSVTYFAYDPAGRKNFETNANNQLLQCYYTPAGDLTNLIDGGGHSVVWGYDSYGQVTNKLDQIGTQVLSYVYDPAGRLTNRWSAAKGNSTYTYDPAGNLTNIAYPVSHGVALQYDALNRVIQMVDGVGTNNYTYTAGGQLATEGGAFASDTLTNTYLNRLRTALSLAQPAGSWTNGFVYDAAGRLTNVTSQAGSFGYTLGGSSPASLSPKVVALPNASSITNLYDPVARVAGTFLVTSSGTIVDSASYGYNIVGERTTFTNAAGTYVQYTYDNIGQLKVGTSSLSTENRGYVIDSCWNLNWRTNNGIASHFICNTQNELTNASNATYAYDLNGNLTNGNSGQNLYFYDDENRLTDWYSLQIPGQTNNGDLHTQFIIDGVGRIRKRLESSFLSKGVWIVNSTTKYIYDSKRVIQERNWSDNPLVAYTRGPDLSGTFEGAGGIGGLLARSDGYAGGNFTSHNYYHADGNGNITCLENSIQAASATYRYDPFGNTTASSGSLASSNVYRFSSKEVHVNSGTYYYLHRFYDPNQQRWFAPDPFGEPGFEAGRATAVRRSQMGDSVPDPNTYRFVRNDPLIRIDPEGLWESQWPTTLVTCCLQIAPFAGRLTCCIRAQTVCLDGCEAEYGVAAPPGEDDPAALSACRNDCLVNGAKCAGRSFKPPKPKPGSGPTSS